MNILDAPEWILFLVKVILTTFFTIILCLHTYRKKVNIIKKYPQSNSPQGRINQFGNQAELEPAEREYLLAEVARLSVVAPSERIKYYEVCAN